MHDPWIDRPWNCRTARRLMPAALVGLLILAGSVSAQTFAGWTHRMTVTFTGYDRSETLINFPVLVVLSNNVDGSGFSYAHFASATGDDLRFAASDETTELNYEIEQWDTNGTSYVWVQAPELVNPNSSIYAYWGNSVATQPAYTTNGATWANGYSGVWHLNDSDPEDSTAQRNHGTGHGNTNVAGRIGGGQGFNGSTAYARVPHHVSLTYGAPVNQRTLSAWIKPGTGGYFLSKGRPISSANIDYTLISGTTNLTMWRWSQGNARSSSMTGYGPVLNDGAWHHVAFVNEGAGARRILIDGALVATDTVVWTDDNSNTEPLEFGRYVNYIWGMHYYGGAIDEMRISQVARSDDWLWASWMTVASNTVLQSYSPVEFLSVLSVHALPASDIGATRVTLRGQLGQIGGVENPSVFFCLDSVDLGTVVTSDWTRVIDIGADWAAGESFSVNATGLLPGSNYAYRVYATNSSGVAWSGSAQFFQTVSLPAVTNRGAIESSVSAVLRGEVTETGNESPLIRFHWWADGSALTNEIAVGNHAGAFSHALSGHDPAPLYHYRIEASNDAGSVWSHVESFRIPPAHWFVATSGSDANAGTSWAAPFATIQKGIDSASAGQRIAVSNGTYALSAEINLNKGVTVGSVNGAEVTILDAEQEYPGWRRVIGITDGGAILDGFTLTRGRLQIHLGYGGGVYLTDGMLINSVVSNCMSQFQHNVGGGGRAGGVYMTGGVVSNTTIVNNRTRPHETDQSFGGGLYMTGGLLVDSRLLSNRAPAGRGGGVYLVDGVVLRTRIAGNDANGGRGGGIAMSGGTVDACEIDANFCDQSSVGGGGGILMSGGTVTGSRISRNWTHLLNNVGGSSHGGGVWMTGGRLSDSVVVSNRAQGWTAGSRGGGIYLDHADALVEKTVVKYNYARRYDSQTTGHGSGIFVNAGTVRNCLIVGNGDTSARYGGGVYMAGGLLESSTIKGNRAATSGGGIEGGTALNCIIVGNTAPSGANHTGSAISYSLSTPLPSGAGNIDAVPRFIEPGSGLGLDHVIGDYRLDQGSPALRKGDNQAWMSGARDLDGNPRISLGRVDLGCYERLPRGNIIMFR